VLLGERRESVREILFGWRLSVSSGSPQGLGIEGQGTLYIRLGQHSECIPLSPGIFVSGR
jgi:hypothetical protein